MPRASARQTTLIAALVASAATAHAEVGGTLSLLSDARERGLSYSGKQPSAQLGLAWDGAKGWYAGTRLAPAHFEIQCCGALVQSYGGRVFGLAAWAPGLDGEAGVLVHHYTRISRYDFHEVYAGLLGERWNLRVFQSPNYYGGGQRTWYGDFNLRWPLFTGMAGMAAIGHIGWLHTGGGQPPAYAPPSGPTRWDLRIGASWPVELLGASSEWQLAAVTASSGGPYTYLDTSHRSQLVLSLTLAF